MITPSGTEIIASGCRSRRISSLRWDRIDDFGDVDGEIVSRSSDRRAIKHTDLLAGKEADLAISALTHTCRKGGKKTNALLTGDNTV